MNVTTISKRTIRTNNTKPKQPKHTWLEQEDRLCSYLYLHGKPFHHAHSLLPHILSSSIKCKFQNCAYLEKKSSMSQNGSVTSGKGLDHCSKQHVRMFTEQRELLLSHILSSSYK
jgi:hypothetical protein